MNTALLAQLQIFLASPACAASPPRLASWASRPPPWARRSGRAPGGSVRARVSGFPIPDHRRALRRWARTRPPQV